MGLRRSTTTRPTPMASGPPQAPRRRGVGPFVKRWTIPIIGGVTPVALVVINIAVYINDHVQQLRWGIALAAFLSGMMLNTWVALSLYRFARRHRPQWNLMQEHNQEMMLVVGMFVITVISVASAIFCFYGLGDTKHLPNRETFLYGAVQIAWPVVAKLFVARDGPPSKRGRAARPAPASTGSGGPGAPGASGGGYVPPSWPPS